MNAINMFGPCTLGTGYGVHFVNTCLALDKIGVPITITPVSKIDITTINDERFLELAKKPFDYSAPSIKIWFGNRLQDFVGKKRIAFPVFETSLIPLDWHNHLKNVDAIFVPSRWAKDIINTTVDGHPPIHIIHEGVDLDKFGAYPNPYPPDFRCPRPFIISIGKFEERKGQKLLIEVASKLNQPASFICLWENPFNPSWREQASRLLTMFGFRCVNTMPTTWANEHDVTFVFQNPVPKHEALVRIITSCDFGVYPHLGEGWGLPILETMACGVPVLATYSTGPMEYLYKSSQELLLEDTTPVLPPVGFGPGHWLKPNIDELHKKLLALLKIYTSDPSILKSFGMLARSDAEAFSWENSAKEIVSAIQTI